MMSVQGERSRRRNVALWIVAVVLTVAAAYYQRRTGPSYPAKGDFEVAGRTYHYSLVRNAVTPDAARVAIPNPGPGVGGTLYYRRHPTSDPFVAVPLARENGELVAFLPAQPPAGKVEYFLRLDTPDGRLIIPGPDHGNVVMRFKNHVPLISLLPHILLMFLSLTVGVRAGLAAVFEPSSMRRLVWATLAGMTVGGMILGPIAQWYAFGAFWTGFPYGYDLTDNKVLVMWLVWVVAALGLGIRARKAGRPGRLAVVLATALTLVVYVIPHSARGTELDYELLRQGVPPSEALKSG